MSYFDTSDENKCNWMMFVRPADSYADQNCVAYQYGLDIYFTVTRNIEARAEIKVSRKFLQTLYSLTNISIYTDILGWIV